MARPRGSKQQRAAEKRMVNGKGKLIGYIRVSTAGQGERGHSLDGQAARLCERAAREGFEVVDIIREVASGAKERDGLKEAQARIMAGEAEGLLFAKMDRLGRSMRHLAGLVEWAEDNQITLLSTEEGLMMEGGKLRHQTLHFLIAMAQVERNLISQRTREGLEAAKAKGVQLGRPAVHAGQVAEEAAALRRQGLPLQKVAEELTARGYRNARGAALGVKTVWNMINRVDPAANPEGGYRGNLVGAAG